ncbi:MAG: class I adenylate-forming enzyme family protein [Nevskia sp.]|nr:class I adenylate-forming enzyme family protein [Nevskia sp.]
MNIATILEMAAEAFGDRTALVSGATRMTYAELRIAAQRAAMAIRASRARYVALLDVNSPAAPVAIFGAAYAGVPYVPLNYRLTHAEVNELVERIAPAYLVAGADYRALLQPRDDVQVVQREAFLALPDLGQALPEPEEDPRAVAVQLFTSGTTGKPKAAILRHENLMSYIVGTVEFGAAAEDDAVLVTVPPYHIAGISAVLSSTYACRRMVQLDGFDAAAWLHACRAEHVSNVFLVPTMLGRIVDHLMERGEAAALPALRAVAYGGGKMPLSTIQRAMALLPQVDFTNAYGLTETSSTIAVLGPDDHRAAAASEDPLVRKRLASVGRATGAVEIAIRDDDGKPLGTNQPGLVYVRGGQVSGEYLSLGSALDGDGWFCTRDRGYLDEEGYLFLEGRADDVIVRGGENISPGEIEEILLGHPAVADAAVVAVPDEQWGEGVGAVVVLKENARASVAELQDLVKQHLRSSRVPQTIVFRDALPYNELGKVLRRVIRQELSASQVPA